MGIKNTIGADDVKFRETARRFGFAWVFLCISLAFHVTDEAMMGFLSYYNPAVVAIRQRIPFLPLPTFTFAEWIAGLAIGIVILLCLSPFVFWGSRFTIWLAYPLSVIMFLNGVNHVVWSFCIWRFAPGVYSSPVLLLTSAYLFIQTYKQHKRTRENRP